MIDRLRSPSGLLPLPEFLFISGYSRDFIRGPIPRIYAPLAVRPQHRVRVCPMTGTRRQRRPLKTNSATAPPSKHPRADRSATYDNITTRSSSNFPRQSAHPPDTPLLRPTPPQGPLNTLSASARPMGSKLSNTQPAREVNRGHGMPIHPDHGAGRDHKYRRRKNHAVVEANQCRVGKPCAPSVAPD